MPDEMPIRPGDLVLVPLQTRLLPGVVVSVVGETPAFPTKPVEDRVAEDAFVGPLQLTLARWIAAHYRAPLYDCLALFLPPGLAARLASAAKKGTWKDPTAPPIPADPPMLPPPHPGPPLTLQQESAARQIIGAIEQRQHKAFLLHGVTGSGKTHVYFEAVARTLEARRQAIVLVPEIALTPATLARFEERFPGRVAVLHSQLPAKQHRLNWERVRRGEADIVVGSRSALFAPVRRPGLVILDEEQEPSYRQDNSPRYHAREVALWWGQLARAPVVLGSATPDIESYFRAERGRYTLLTLPTRYLTPRPAARREYRLRRHHLLRGAGEISTVESGVEPDQIDTEDAVGSGLEPDRVGTGDGDRAGAGSDRIGTGYAAGSGLAPDDVGAEERGRLGLEPDRLGTEDAVGSRVAPERVGTEERGRFPGVNAFRRQPQPAPTRPPAVGAGFKHPTRSGPNPNLPASPSGTPGTSDPRYLHARPHDAPGSPDNPNVSASPHPPGSAPNHLDPPSHSPLSAPVGAQFIAPEAVRADLRNLPPVAIVDMRAELKAGNTSIFSRELEAALEHTLGRGEQALLFLNRRGSATCVSCRDCGYVLTCRRCDIPVVYHRAGEALVCHRCNRRRPLPDRCPGCVGTRIRFFGTGTQRVEQELSDRFPQARVIRWDRDTTGKKDAYEDLWRAFTAGEADVMVGTQMIAKALDFPRVTLVGVVLADVGLFLPDFRAGERAFQLLSQMAGRSGRGVLGGRAVVQTYVPDHYAIQAAATHDYQAFYDREIAFRRAHGYPPLGRLVRLLYSGSKEHRCVRETRRVRSLLDQEIVRQGIADIHVMGPAPCFAERARGRFRWAVLLRGDRFARILDKLELPPGWTIDVDPVSLL